jgi:hypothetical protein
MSVRIAQGSGCQRLEPRPLAGPLRANLGSAAALSASSVFRPVDMAADRLALWSGTTELLVARDGHNPHILERSDRRLATARTLAPIRGLCGMTVRWRSPAEPRQQHLARSPAVCAGPRSRAASASRCSAVNAHANFARLDISLDTTAASNRPDVNAARCRSSRRLTASGENREPVARHSFSIVRLWLVVGEAAKPP